MLDTLAGSYPYSLMRGFQCTDDGRFLYLAEGGSIAVLDTEDSGGGPYQPGMDDEVKRPPVGKLGVIGARMVLDPDAAVHPIDGDNDLMYIAGGRDGLWAMGADHRLGKENWTARIDDSGNLDPSTQESRRWCSDVATFELDGKDYLAALFQRRDKNRLRIYELQRVRDAFADSKSNDQETGWEIAPDRQVVLSTRPAPFSPNQDHGGSVALAMHVEEVSPTHVDVYVAMGPHGLVKVELYPLFPTPVPRLWGPVFGDGTAMAADPKYDNYEMSLGLGCPVERTEPPVFTDVVTWSEGSDHYLYAAVDHLNWVRFDLNTTWDEGMLIDHQEGEFVTNDFGEDQIKPVDAPTEDPQLSYGRQLEIVDHPLGPILAVTMHNLYFWKGPYIYTEGPPYDTNAEGGGTSAKPGPSRVRTAFYRLDDQDQWTSEQFNTNAWVDSGGSTLRLVPQQPVAGNKVELFHNVNVDELSGKVKATCKNLVDVSGNGPTAPYVPPPGDQIVRDELDCVGAHSFTIGYCTFSDRLILTGQTEAGSRHDGLLVTNTSATTGDVTFEVRTDTPGQAEDPEDARTMSTVGENECQWRPDPDNSPDLLRLIGNENVPFMKWGVSDVHVNPTNAADPTDEPEVLKQVGLKPVEDRYKNLSRIVHGTGTRSAAMDEQYDYLTGKKLLVAFSGGMKTPEGAFVVHREDLDPDVDGESDQGDLDTQQLYTPELLGTHPEFDEMEVVPAAETWWGTAEFDTVNDIKGAHGAVFNWAPRFMPVEDAAGDMKQWVLAVPCGKVWFDPTWPGIDSANWTPDAYWTGKHGQSMVQFWPVVVDENGDLDVDVGSSPVISPGLFNSPLPRLFGPAPGAAIRVDHVLLDKDLNGTEASYCIVSDWAGRVIAADITKIVTNGNIDEVIGTTHTASVWTWEDIPPGTLDDLDQNVNAVAVDKIDDKVAYLYVGIRRTGVQVLKFEPSAGGLTAVKLLQTPGNAWDVFVRPANGARPEQLFVGDLEGGIRVYKD